jgi:hypothetical protein
MVNVETMSNPVTMVLQVMRSLLGIPWNTLTAQTSNDEQTKMSFLYPASDAEIDLDEFSDGEVPQPRAGGEREHEGGAVGVHGRRERAEEAERRVEGSSAGIRSKEGVAGRDVGGGCGRSGELRLESGEDAGASNIERRARSSSALYVADLHCGWRSGPRA